MSEDETRSVVDDIDAQSAAVPTWLRRVLPRQIKKVLVHVYWLAYDATDWLAEVVGRCPSHVCRRICYRRMLGVSLGNGTTVHRLCRFYRAKGVTIGDHTVINRQVLLDGRYGLRIGNNVSISEGVMLLTAGHDPQDGQFGLIGAKVVIEDRVFVGARAIVLPGVRLSEGCVVGSGAVVSRDVPEYDIVAGVPAKRIGRRARNLNYELDYAKFLG